MMKREKMETYAMKKMLTTLLLGLLALTASAQTWLSGEMRYRFSNTALSGESMDANTNFGLTAEAGHYLNSQWALGVVLGFTHYEGGEVKLVDQTVIGTGNELLVRPFARYVLYRTGRFTFFADGGVHYKMLKMESFSSPLHTLGLGVSPGLSLSISDRIGLVTHLGSAGFDHSWMKNRSNYTWMKPQALTLTNNTLSFDLFDSLSFGVYVHL